MALTHLQQLEAESPHQSAIVSRGPDMWCWPSVMMAVVSTSMP